MRPALPVPAIFAHRGFSSQAPENTIPAFLKAVEIGANGIELDVQLSADGEIVVFHDSMLDRTTNGNGKVSERLLSSLKKLDAGSWFSIDYKGVNIPTLQEVFNEIPDNFLINVELKNDRNQVEILPSKVVELLKKNNKFEQVLISSFSVDMIKEMQKHLPQIKIGLLAMPSILGFKTRNFTSRRIAHYAMHPFHLDVKPKLIKRYNDEGKRIHTYTVNKEEQMRKLFMMGTHGIFTDHPDIAKNIRAEVLA
jgi:glycerophosphoryl diester phosphodiesterase